MCRHKRTCQKVKIYFVLNVNTLNVSRSSRKVLEVQPNIQYVKCEPAFLGEIRGLTCKGFHLTRSKGIAWTLLRERERSE